jgi:GDP-4-dehydro-6-deoxy-D-mannose reductase
LRVLITGASGFAGGYLARACVEAGDEVVGIARRGVAPTAAGQAAFESRSIDLIDAPAVRALVREVRPDVVYHLAALSSVGRSWENPAQTVQDNVTTSVNVLEGVRHEAPAARLVWVSSCEVYGAPDHLPIGEDAPLKPANPYAVSKAAGDLLAGVYGEAYELQIVRARPFSHAGPGQRPMFIVSSLARQAAEARIAGAEVAQIVTGNPETRRDFTDVRDVAAAYRLLAAVAGPGIYNVSSGHSISGSEQVRLLGELIAPIRVEHVVDPSRVRAHEVMDLRGAHDRLSAATGWQPEIPFRQLLSDTVDWWTEELVRSPPAVRH